MVLGREILMGGVGRRRKGHAELGLISASMAVRRKANANGKIVLRMDLMRSGNLGLDFDLARAGVKTGPYVGKRQPLAPSAALKRLFACSFCSG
jgi:hypothetical protein